MSHLSILQAYIEVFLKKKISLGIEVRNVCKHQLKITLRKDGEQPINVAEFKKLPLIERMYSRWFGNAQKLMVIVPQDCVQKIEIKEIQIWQYHISIKKKHLNL